MNAHFSIFFDDAGAPRPNCGHCLRKKFQDAPDTSEILLDWMNGSNKWNVKSKWT